MRIQVRDYEPDDADGVALLCVELGCASLTDPHVVDRVFCAPGVSAVVAVHRNEVVGFAQAQGDGLLQSHLSVLAVAPAHRRRGVARRLVQTVFAATGTLRMDVVTDSADAFVRTLPHQAMSGYRVHPGTNR
ncbi:MAG TPA: GNAT family N-acetyltransferase [Candidatus Dormibacteraeota bacterium]|jgi:ribosomal protein S18 acetylase RimI-like enzyme